ncbi:sigma factor-like helix-turn-helix DNA-binding protein [Streptomyces afghaniensis]
MRTGRPSRHEDAHAKQRAVFVLREVFDFSYSEIAAAIGKSEEAVRQPARPRPGARPWTLAGRKPS